MAHVILDPGHGGRDPGAVGYGLREADVVLAVCLRAAEILRQHRVQVTLTRTDNTTLEPAARVRKVNAAQGDAVVSVHCNASASPDANGTETYHSIFSKPGKGGHALARALQFHVVAALGTTNRGVKTRKGRNGRDYYYMIRETKPPAAIIELAFITNANDARLLQSKRDQAAVAVARGVLDYFGIPYQAPVRQAPAAPPAPAAPKPSAAPAPAEPGEGFRDVPAAHREAVEALRRAGIVAGYGDGTFRPDEPVTRMEAALMLYRLLRHVRGDGA